MIAVKKYMRKTAKKGKKYVMMLMLMMLSLTMFAVPGLCEATPSPTPAPQLEIEFDMTQAFSWAQTIINAMLPVVYIMMGVGLGFLIINALKRAFA